MYRNQLKRGTIGENYCVAVFTLERLDDIAAVMGYEAAQEVIKSMADVYRQTRERGGGLLDPAGG